jgi:phosphoenolpyruvate carboxylase
MCRNPYIDTLHITQVELMRHLREHDKDEEPLLGY